MTAATKRRKAAKSIPVPPLHECRHQGESIQIPIAGGGAVWIDTADHHLVDGIPWHWGGTGRLYAVSKSKIFGGKTTYMHRRLAGARRGQKVDHADGNRRNCRQRNLRKCTSSQNGANRSTTKAASGFCGVYRYPGKRKPWRASVVCEGATYRGPYRADAETAAHDHDALARGLFGEFATVNFPAPGERRCKPIGPALEARQSAKEADRQPINAVA